MLIGVCPVCQRHEVVTPPQLLSATLFQEYPQLQKRLEWRQNINRNIGLPDLQFDPTQLKHQNLPSKILPRYQDLPSREKQKKKIDQLEV